MRFIKLFFAIVCLATTTGIFAQCDTIAYRCSGHISNEFISDGQQYRSLLLDDQVAEFHATFFGGTIYRIAACSGREEGHLILRLYDGERNELYSSADHENTPYWDFEVKSTLDVIIEAQLDPTASSGCAVLLIGFQQ